jgi:hypothetical protein
MSSRLQEKPKHQVISACFLKLAALKTYQNQWRTIQQWASLIWAHCQVVISPLLNEDEDLDGKLIDASVKKEKVITNNLQNYNAGTTTIGIMCRDYKPTVILNGVKK